MSLANLTFMASNLNSAIDSGRYDTLTVGEVRRVVQDGTVFAFLENNLGNDIDLSIFDANPAAKAELLAEWQDMDNAIDARRKFGVERRGLPLLIAFLLEGLQRRARTGA